MFDRFTEAARRVIFFARYEASQSGIPTIDPEHLLLGLMRRDTKPTQFLSSPDDVASIRKLIESSWTIHVKISTSVDLPLGRDSKRALAYAAEEAEKLDHKHIDSCHLVLGLLRLETSVAVKVLEQYGVTYAAYREVVRAIPLAEAEQKQWIRQSSAGKYPIEDDPAQKEPAASSLRAPILALDHLLDHAVERVNATSDDYGRQRLKRKSWSRKEGMGHLINLAAAHHQWFASVLTEPRLTVGGYPADEWVSAQQYQDYSWPELVDLWIGLNRLLIHVLSAIPEEKLNTPCRVGIEDPIPLLDLIERYVRHCENILGQILARL